MPPYTTEPPASIPTTTEAVRDSRVMHLITSIEILVLVLGLFGNSMLFMLMCGKRMRQYSFSVYFSFAAVFDTCTIFWNCLQDAYELNHDSSLEATVSRSYTLGCGILEQFDNWFPTTSAWLVVAVCVDRYVSICHQVAAQTFCRRQVALLVCLVLISCTFVYELPWALIFPDRSGIDPSDGPILCGEEPDDNVKGLEVAEDYIQVLIPVVIVTVLNTRVLLTLKRKKAFRKETSLTEHGRQQNRINMYNVSIFYLLVITVVAWIPWMVSNMIVTYYYDYEGHAENTDTRIHVSYAWHATLVIWLFTFTHNFYVLMIMSPVYRKEFKKQCACLPWCRSVPFEHLEVNRHENKNEDETRDL